VPKIPAFLRKQRSYIAAWNLTGIIGWNHGCLDFFALFLNESSMLHAGCCV